jgi:hypothetical protein
MILTNLFSLLIILKLIIFLYLEISNSKVMVFFASYLIFPTPGMFNCMKNIDFFLKYSIIYVADDIHYKNLDLFEFLKHKLLCN